MDSGAEFIEGILLGGLSARGRSASRSSSGFGGALATRVAEVFTEYESLPKEERRRRVKSALDQCRPVVALTPKLPPLAGAAIATRLCPADARKAERAAGPRRASHLISPTLVGLLLHYAAAPSGAAKEHLGDESSGGLQP